MVDPVKTAESREAEIYAQRVGSTIRGKWHVDALLGVGGMAAVYAGTHRNGQRAALKVLHVNFARDKTVCERFTREAYVSNRIQHPACVQVLDDDVTDEEEPYLVMELLVGKTLREVWRELGPRVPVAQALGFTVPILDCLSACHAVGVIHRDLKPANIFVCDTGAIKVLDFGIAQFRSAAAEHTATGTALGTPSYMAPEQAMGLVDQLDGRADLFSVGAMLHALVTGHRINKARTENEALILAATKPVPSAARIAPDLPVEVIALIDKSLAWDRRNRFADAREMLEAVQATIAAVRSPRTAATPAGPTAAARARGGTIEFEPDYGAQQPPVEVAAPEEPSPDGWGVAADDPRLDALRDAYRRIDRVLPSVRQLGWDHGSTTRALRGAFEAIAELASNAPVECAVLPYSFTWAEHTIWEPAAPFDAVPYNLFACGVRGIRLTRGITFDELRSLLSLFLLEPGRDLPPEDDLASSLWERGLEHVEVDVADAFVEGDAAVREAFYGEADEVEKQAIEARAHASRVEARAMAVSTDRDALQASRAQQASPMHLDGVVRAVLADQLAVSGEAWNDRYVDVLLEGLVDAGRHKDAPVVLASLRASAADLAVAGQLKAVVTLHRELVERATDRLPATVVAQLQRALSGALFGGETLALALRALETDPAGLETLAPVLDTLSVRELPVVLEGLKRPFATPVRSALLAFVARVMVGHEAQVAAATAQLDTDTACSLVELLAAANSPAAREALATLLRSEDLAVRLEAKLRLASSPEAAQGELVAMLENRSSAARTAALGTLARHRMVGAWPMVARMVRAGEFPERPPEEQRAVLDTILLLGGDRGEPLALEMAKKSGVLASGRREALRVCVIDALGQHARSQAALDAMREIAQTRWGTSEETRGAAQAAADRIATRVGRPAGGAAPSEGTP